MNEKIDLKKVEKQTYQFTFTDGIYDMAYGSLIFFIAIAPILREILYPSYIIFLVLPPSLIILLGTRFITVPRIGIVRFNQKRIKSRKIFITCDHGITKIKNNDHKKESF